MEDLAKLARIFQYLRCLVQKSRTSALHVDHTQVDYKTRPHIHKRIIKNFLIFAMPRAKVT